MNLKELGIMTFPEASERWNKERTYVLQQYNNYPEKFLEGTFTKIGNGKGTQIISREGMEYLTGMTEQEANNEVWKIIVLQDSNIVNEKIATSEKKAYLQYSKLVRDYLEWTGVSIKDIPKLTYLDKAQKNRGIKFDFGTVIYYKKEK
ncbi:helix-turn-helix domain-containing protein [Candidatus Enterococcus mansonii]|uniref:Helix-turn-helix domain-containing protein n=1 Tax=Candidatus Enterococcus mansonii TaxID=1834181 RepID=A0A242BYF4_9ENTE|nr:helix-turn-helix domain-containing protein [Enterococcus sp. 4G2_DIV0659]OTO03045.1 hypothetical protein A5880_003156 [Enterococcus sp. 4G2_DIV0659]